MPGTVLSANETSVKTKRKKKKKNCQYFRIPEAFMDINQMISKVNVKLQL